MNPILALKEVSCIEGPIKIDGVVTPMMKADAFKRWVRHQSTSKVSIDGR
jgi:hypothetical protein